MHIAIALFAALAVLAIPIAVLLYLSSLIFKWPEIRHWSKWSALAGSAVFVICVAISPPPDRTNDTATPRSPTAQAASAAAPPAQPAYCGTKATERLPECGWTEAKQAATDKKIDAQKQTISDSAACFAAREFVTDRLKSPSTASFPWFGCAATQLADNKWEVASYVDAQNSFGGTLRLYYLITVRPNEGGGWHLLSIQTAQK